ncbi:hypothetical protein FRZ61_31790 [Hypericibacter adhaerens]|jgi:hypothetical protein|uniref:Double-GTPase 2 domain-containing protein n=2 Tax=Hypericibacter adhaerens TaxID=2602016 RepID=A0A5J6N2S6_9PROT|nr:hypothetical protein FRZ61_31790 [Hypericibacter adhaerens]
MATLTHRTYGTVVGILGSPNAGKTAAIVSLYLLLATNKLSGYEFRDSQTLMALEQISRGARRWSEHNPPSEFTTHTELPSERLAGFIHLRIERIQDSKRADLLLPDLPGEWSEQLIDSNRVDRLEFLKGADAIWIMVDGLEMANDETRQHTRHRMAMLLERIAVFLSPRVPPITVVVTRRDKGVLPPHAFANLFDDASHRGISIRLIQIASFSEDDAVAPGSGLSELLDGLLVVEPVSIAFWPDATDHGGERQLLKFRSVHS